MLHPWIDGGVDLQTATVQFLGSYLVFQYTGEISQVIGVGIDCRSRWNDSKFLFYNCLSLCRRDDFLIHQHPHHHSLPLLKAFHIAVGRIIFRGLDYPGQHSHLRFIQLSYVLTEIALGCTGHPRTPPPRIYLIQIHVEDGFFGIFILDRNRNEQFLYFADKTLFLGQEKSSGQLLGDGTAALSLGTRTQVVINGPPDAPGIVAVMLIEAPILYRHHGFFQEFREILAVLTLIANFRHFRAITVISYGLFLNLVFPTADAGKKISCSGGGLGEGDPNEKEQSEDKSPNCNHTAFDYRSHNPMPLIL